MGRRRNKKPDFGSPEFLADSMDSFMALEEHKAKVERERLHDAQMAIQDRDEWTLDEIYNLERAVNCLYKRDSQALNLYTPTAGAANFHNSLAGERGLVGSNRSGKSVASAVEVAWAATGTHPVEGAYPIGNMEICVVGPRLEHLALLYNMLFGTGRTFKVLKNGIDWEVPRWTVPEQMARQREWIDAPPLIPPEMVYWDNMSWYSKPADQPSIIRLKNGTNFYFFSFEQDAPRGVAFNLCLAGNSELYDPVSMSMVRMDSQRHPFHVNSYNEVTGQVEVKMASRPFVKGVGEQLKVTLSDGSVLFVARGHQVLSSDGEWIEISDAYARRLSIHRPSFAVECLSHGEDAAQMTGMSRTSQKSSRCLLCRKGLGVARSSTGEVCTKLNPDSCAVASGRLAIQEVQDSLCGYHPSLRFCDGQLRAGQDAFLYASPSPACVRQHSLCCLCVGEMARISGCIHTESLLDSCLLASLTYCSLVCCQPSLLAQLLPAKRQVSCTHQISSDSRQHKVCEPLQDRLPSCGTRQVPSSLCQPPETNALEPASLCRSALLSTQGFFDHRSTTSAGCLPQEMASSEQVSELLADTDTYRLSSLSPKDKQNATNQCYVTRCESLGNDLVWDISVDDNHNYIYGGIVNHNCWLDEEARGVDKWLSELRARAISVMGRLIWSSTPESATPTFYDLKTRSERPDMKDKVPYKRTEFFELLSKDNPYLPPLGLEAASERLHEDDPEAASAKIDGEWTFRRFLVYPEFDENKHIIEPFDIEWRDSCYAITDPGRTRNGTLFVALLHPESPHYLPDQPDRLVCFDEMYLQTARQKGTGNYEGINANMYAKNFAAKWRPYKHWLEDITFDWQQGRKKDEFDVEIMEHYRTELEAVSIIPRTRNFQRAKANITYGIEEVSKHLVPAENKPPKLVIMRGKCPQLVYEMKKYQREQLRGANGRLTPGKPIAKRTEMVDCVRYACCRGYTWVMPPSSEQGRSAFTYDELRTLANDDKAFVKQMFGDFYSQFDRKPKIRR